MLKRILPFALAGIILTLAACMVPEKFTAEYEIKPDGGYAFVYEGTMVDALSRMARLEAEKEGEDMPAADNLQELVGAFKSDPRVIEFKEVSKETYQVRMEDKGNIKEALTVHFIDDKLDYWRLIYSAEANTVTLEIAPLKAKDLDEVQVKIDGSFEIKTDCEIVSSTVELDESFFSNTYSFKVDNTLSEGASIIMKLQ